MPSGGCHLAEERSSSNSSGRHILFFPGEQLFSTGASPTTYGGADGAGDGEGPAIEVIEIRTPQSMRIGEIPGPSRQCRKIVRRVLVEQVS